MGRFLQIGKDIAIIDVKKSTPAPAVPPVEPAVLTPREVVLKAAAEAYQKASYAGDQTNGGTGGAIGAGTPTPVVSTEVTIPVAALQDEETPDTQEFVPSDVRAANDLRKARRNAARSPHFSNPLDLAR